MFFHVAASHAEWWSDWPRFRDICLHINGSKLNGQFSSELFYVCVCVCVCVCSTGITPKLDRSTLHDRGGRGGGWLFQFASPSVTITTTLNIICFFTKSFNIDIFIRRVCVCVCECVCVGGCL